MYSLYLHELICWSKKWNYLDILLPTQSSSSFLLFFALPYSLFLKLFRFYRLLIWQPFNYMTCEGPSSSIRRRRRRSCGSNTIILASNRLKLMLIVFIAVYRLSSSSLFLSPFYWYLCICICSMSCWDSLCAIDTRLNPQSVPFDGS